MICAGATVGAGERICGLQEYEEDEIDEENRSAHRGDYRSSVWLRGVAVLDESA